jgi:hypothetical protein
MKKSVKDGSFISVILAQKVSPAILQIREGVLSQRNWRILPTAPKFRIPFAYTDYTTQNATLAVAFYAPKWSIAYPSHRMASPQKMLDFLMGKLRKMGKEEISWSESHIGSFLISPLSGKWPVLVCRTLLGKPMPRLNLGR